MKNFFTKLKLSPKTIYWKIKHFMSCDTLTETWQIWTKVDHWTAVPCVGIGIYRWINKYTFPTFRHDADNAAAALLLLFLSFVENCHAMMLLRLLSTSKLLRTTATIIQGRKIMLINENRLGCVSESFSVIVSVDIIAHKMTTNIFSCNGFSSLLWIVRKIGVARCFNR